MTQAITPWNCPAVARVRGGGSKGQGALANPEKSGGAKLRDCRVPSDCQAGGAMFAGLQAA